MSEKYGLDDETPDGFKGGQGRTGEEISDTAQWCIVIIVFAIIAAASCALINWACCVCDMP